MTNDSGPSLAGKIALITGASRGIGRAIAQRMASAGATVVVAARSLGSTGFGAQNRSIEAAGTLRETVEMIEAAGGRAIAIAVDLDDNADRETLVRRAVAAAGGLDILVNNAGITTFAPPETISIELVDRTINHYFRVPFLLSQAAIPYMTARGGGWIVNVGSVAAMRPLDNHNRVDGDVVYAACKAALARMTQGLALELLPRNIAVNLVAPSTAVRTPGSAQLIPDEFEAEDVAYLAETALALAHLPAAERSGILAYSMHFPNEYGLRVRTLDNRADMPAAEVPSASHPDTNFHSRYMGKR